VYNMLLLKVSMQSDKTRMRVYEGNNHVSVV